MILPSLSLSIQICCSVTNAIIVGKSKHLKKTECLKKVGISILKEIFVVY